MNEWIRVKDRMPPDLHEVMFFYVIIDNPSSSIGKKDIVCGHVENGVWHICYLYHSVPLNFRVHVTHWKELPIN